MHGLFLYIFNILVHACTTCFVLQMFWKFFSKSFANSQRYMNKILRSIFKIWNFLPPFQMLFLWLKQNSPKGNSPLSVQENFRNFWRYYFLPLLNTIRYQFENFILKLGGGAVLLLWANTSSPFGMNRQNRSH